MAKLLFLLNNCDETVGLIPSFFLKGFTTLYILQIMHEIFHM